MHVLHRNMLTRALRSKAIPEILTFIPVIKNKFGLDGAVFERHNTKNVCTHKALFEIRESL